MHSSAFIIQADQALTTHLYNQLKTSPTTQSILTNPQQISLNPPKPDTKTKLTLFLYRITAENTPKNVGELQAAFTLHYLACPTTGKTEEDHALLGGIIEATLEAPMVVVPEEQELRVMVESLSLDELGKLWAALGTPFMSAVSIVVSSKTTCGTFGTAPVASSAQEVKVIELFAVVQNMFTGQVKDWKKRNMIQKQWIMQDFKKITEMTPEEMQVTLNSLGEKLEMHRPIEDFVEPVKRLAQFYEHQRDGLKGMEKFSAKQKENTTMIEGWLRDTQALLEAIKQLLPQNQTQT